MHDDMYENMIYDEYAHMYSYIPGYEFSMDHDQQVTYVPSLLS